MSEHAAEALVAPAEPMAEVAARAKATWARLIRKVYEADDPPVVRRILEHLGRWEPLPVERGPPEPDWRPGTVIPLTYHPVPDIA